MQAEHLPVMPALHTTRKQIHLLYTVIFLPGLFGLTLLDMLMATRGLIIWVHRAIQVAMALTEHQGSRVLMALTEHRGSRVIMVLPEHRAIQVAMALTEHRDFLASQV